MWNLAILLLLPRYCISGRGKSVLVERKREGKGREAVTMSGMQAKREASKEADRNIGSVSI